MDVMSAAIVYGVSFGRTVWGLLTRPYETYRRIAGHGKLGELIFVVALLVIYFALASAVKVTAFRPFLLTRQFIVLLMGAVSSISISVGSLWVAGRLFGGKPKLEVVLLAWAYTLIPTVSWFMTTSILYVLLPPPRTTSALGILFSLLFLVFSATLLWWKVTLAYLTLRFGLKFDFAKSVGVALFCAPILFGWSYLLYKAGIFKVPFL